MHALASRIGPDYVLPACALLVLPVAIIAPLMTTWLAILAALACLPHLRVGEFASRPTYLLFAGAAGFLIVWGAASALGVVLLVVTAIILYIASKLVSLDQFGNK